jgi:hypothetical protein
MNVLVSIGTNIQQPGRLEAEPIGDVLDGICAGRWGEQVAWVRAFPYRSADQQQAKESLPYWTPSGLFRYRNAGGLVNHSGHVAVDLDNLGESAGTQVIQTAVGDGFCVCAFRSATAQGVRLIFSCPPCSAEVHKLVFGRVAQHVRRYYGHQPDLSGSDVARASFVSFDKGLWLNPSAVMLPGLAKLVLQGQATTHKDSLCVVGEPGAGLEAGDVLTLAYGLGESRAACLVRPDGTARTHNALMRLGLDLVVRYQRHGLTLTNSEIEHALAAWFETGKRLGLKYAKDLGHYREDLHKAVRSAQRAPWLPNVVHKWDRWRHHPDFPSTASSDDRLAWAIRRHCSESGTMWFFLGARDAATITGTTFRAAYDTLLRLVRDRVIKRAGKRLNARHAQEYWLLKIE